MTGRLGRYKQIGKKAAQRILRTGAAPAMRYGASIVGASSRVIAKVRRFACAVRGQMGRRSAFARLKLAQYDPGMLLAVDPIVDYAKAVWDGLVSKAELQDAWRRAMTTVCTAKYPFQAVVGPAGAMVASALRIGWKIPAPHVLRMEDGELLDLTEVCPGVIQQYAERALEEREAASCKMAVRLGYIPNLDPLSEVVNVKRYGGSSAHESVRALGEDGWWTQERLFREAFLGVEDDECRACRVSPFNRKAKVTLDHRCVECPATRAVRESFKDQEIIHEAQRIVTGSSPLFVNGIPAAAPRRKRPAFIERLCGGRAPGLDDDFDWTFSGQAFTDGAMTGPALARLRRAGWAAVCVNGDGAVLHGLHGTCPDDFPTAFRSKLWAVERILMYTCPPLTMRVDNQGVIDGIERGAAWCCSSSRPAADLWRKNWWRLNDIGLEGLVFVKVKGHATQADVDSGRVSKFHRTGNDHADHFAGRGVEVAEHDSPVERDREEHKKAKRWYKWLLTLVRSWPADTQPYDKKRRDEQAVQEQPTDGAQVVSTQNWAAIKRHARLPHTLVQQHGGVWCTACQRHAELSSSIRSMRALVESPCSGGMLNVREGATIAAPCRGGVRQNGHDLW